MERGEYIAQVGLHPERNMYLLHFEIRRGYKAADPLKYVKIYE